MSTSDVFCLMTTSDTSVQAQTSTRRAPRRTSPSTVVTSTPTVSPMRYVLQRPSRSTYSDKLPFPQYHTGRGNFTFDTPEGILFTLGLNELAKSFNLSSQFGVAPQDYTITQ